MTEKIIFFAYKGKYRGTQDDNVESINRATKEYNEHQKKYVAKTWEEYKKSTHISAEVLKVIDECEIFVCDLTYFNHNVLFELGYAIGKNKEILILLNPSIDNASKKYENFFLKQVRYTSFKNAQDIQTALQQKNYKNNLVETYVKIENLEKNNLDLLYIKSKLNNQPSINLSEKIEFLKEQHELSLLVDDPLEVSYRAESWYFKNIHRAKCAIIHFWGENVENAFVENAQNSFFAGLAYGFGIKVLLVAPAKYKAPLDFYEILIQYDSSESLINSVDIWLAKELINKQIEEKIEIIEEHKTNLIKLGIGCEIAEYEKDGLLKYFVETSPYHSALKKEKVIITGRKGSGKTAIYIKLLDELSKDDFSFIINLRPESDELLENIQLSDVFKDLAGKKYFFVSVWKLTIFSKLIYAVYEKLLLKTEYGDHTSEEMKLINFVKNNESFIKMNVYGVISEIYNKLKNTRGDINSPKFLGDLYKEYLGQLLSISKDYLRSTKAKYYKIIIIADNLDQAWDLQGNLDIQTEMIDSLLEIENKIKKELINKENKQIDLKTIIFLRKDIFEYILKKVKEPDKLILMQNEIDWEKYPELLKKVIENRFKYSLDIKKEQDVEKTWKEYFESKSKKPFDSIKLIVTLRPRDIIYFVSQLFDSAINRGGDKVINYDFDNAIKNYASFLNENIIAETKAEYPEISAILSKLQEYNGKKFEYKTFSKILDSFYFNQKKKAEFTKTLFDRGYMLGFDTTTSQPFADIDVLQRKLKEKRWYFFPNKVYVIAHAKYYTIKNIANKAF